MYSNARHQIALCYWFIMHLGNSAATQADSAQAAVVETQDAQPDAWLWFTSNRLSRHVCTKPEPPSLPSAATINPAQLSH